jgi:hypothetical protein
MTRRRRSAIVGLAALLLAPLLIAVEGAGRATAATGTDSIVYLKGGRVWIARADGTGARAFTTGRYNWSAPSEDDHGNVVVLGGLARTNPGGTDSSGSDQIFRFGPRGNQIGRPIPTWGSYSTPSCPTYPPNSARVSPDGTKVAYGIYDCGAFSYTALWTPITSTGLNFPNQRLGQEDFYQPQWIDNSQFVVSHVGTTVTDTQARWFVHPTSGADYAGTGWYDSAITGTGAQAVISRTGTTFAVFSDDAADYTDALPRHVDLFLYSAPSLASAKANAWHLDCTVALSAANTTRPLQLSPSIATDGSKIYWGDDKGVEVAQIQNRSNNCAAVRPTLLIPGGAEPFVSAGGIHPPVAEPIQPGAHYPPHARFSVTPLRPHARKAVIFDGRTSYETLGRIVRYTWHFGDRTAANGRTVKHTYLRAGIYRVQLIVTDGRGITSAVTRALRVLP